MYTGPVAPISTIALEAMDKIIEILRDVPIDDWQFVLSQAEKAAGKARGMHYPRIS